MAALFSLLNLVKLLGLALTLSACGAHAPANSSWSCASTSQDCSSVFVVHDSWHSAIVLRRSDLSSQTMPELNDFPSVQWIEFSWGDRDYFPNPQAGIFAAIRAALWSGGSVVHLVGIDDSLANFYRSASRTELHLTQKAYRRLLDYLGATFLREASTDRARAAPGLFIYSRFYPARRHFGLLRTCNTWTAEALEQAGLPIASGFVISAGQLQRQLLAATATP
jgi:uncharacterized protein (TIGR02117 family)